ncbi:MAG: PadR family transcriptional regulator [Candidatus Cloacimonadales bacterium]
MAKIDLVVLGFLRRKPMYGYEIYTYTTRHGLSNWLKLKKPSVYKALQRLEKSGYISAEQIVSGKHAPRKVFRIEESGSDYFLQLLEAIFWDSDPGHREDFWQALRFVQGNLTREKFLEVIAFRQQVIRQWRSEQQGKISQILANGKLTEIPFIMPIMHQQFASFVQIELKTLADLAAAARLPENKKDFLAERED